MANERPNGWTDGRNCVIRLFVVSSGLWLIESIVEAGSVNVVGSIVLLSIVFRWNVYVLDVRAQTTRFAREEESKVTV